MITAALNSCQSVGYCVLAWSSTDLIGTHTILCQCHYLTWWTNWSYKHLQVLKISGIFRQVCVLYQRHICVYLHCDLSFLWRQRAVHYPVSLTSVRASVQCFPAQTVGKWEPQSVPQGSLISNNRLSFSSYFLDQTAKYNTPRVVDFLPCPKIQHWHQTCSFRNFTSMFVTLMVIGIVEKSLGFCRSWL